MGVKNTGGGSQGKNTGGGCIWAAALPALGQLYSWEPRLQRGGILLANPDYTQRPRRQINIDSAERCRCDVTMFSLLVLGISDITAII